MFQLYPFRGDDYRQVYSQVNEFLQQLNNVNGIEVDRDEIREDTKNYLDYDRAITSVSVCVQFVDGLKSAQTAQIAKVATLYADFTKVVHGEAPEPSDEPENAVAEAYRLVRENGSRFVLDRNSEGYILTDTSDHGIVFWGVYRDEVLARVQQALGIQPAVTVPASDDFDPFLDGDDLP